MKVVFAALNAKYIHVNLAIRSIGKYCAAFSPKLCEFTINDNIDSIIASLYSEKADVIAFSCYIWNIEQILYIAKTLKSVSPDLKIILGGHEVSYTASAILRENPYIDFVIRGAGEKPTHALLEAIHGEREMEDVPSLTYRKNGEIIDNLLSAKDDINDYIFAYDESVAEYNGKILYYETQRGCPFQCSYCLSGNDGKVNFLSMDRVKAELDFFINHNIPLVKFVDRTFNADKKRATEIFRYIIENKRNTTFHFEMAGHLIDDAMLAVLKEAPKGLIQFEIGVQTTNDSTMKSIGRNIAFSNIKENVAKLISMGNVHVHLDLIAGLPYETYESFKKSFDDVVSLRPHVLQLGFLKLLKGSKIRGEAEKFGYIYKEKAPYEVMQNNFLSFDSLIKLKYIEDIFEKYYNSGNFQRSMDYLLSKYTSAFSIFENLYVYMKKQNQLNSAISMEKRYDILKEVFSEDGVADYANADLLTNAKAKVPYETDVKFKEACFAFLKNEKNIEKYLPSFRGEQPRKLYKLFRFARLFGGIYMCENGKGTLTEITCDFPLEKEKNGRKNLYLY